MPTGMWHFIYNTKEVRSPASQWFIKITVNGLAIKYGRQALLLLAEITKRQFQGT